MREGVQLLQETSPGRFLLERQMIVAVELNEPSPWDRRREHPSLAEWDPAVATRVQNQGWGLHRRSDGRHVDIAECFEESACVLGRRRDSHQLIEPIVLARRAAGDELGREDVAEGGLVSAPAGIYESDADIMRLALGRVITPQLALSVRAKKDETLDTCGVLNRVGDPHGPTLRDAKEGEAIESSGFHDRLEVGDQIRECDRIDRAVRQAGATWRRSGRG